MRRREFIALVGGAIVCPTGVRAQPQAGKVPRIGYLRVTSASDRPPLLDAFRQALREIAGNSQRTYDYLLRVSMIASLRRAQELG